MQWVAAYGDCKGVDCRNGGTVIDDANDELAHDANENLFERVLNV